MQSTWDLLGIPKEGVAKGYFEIEFNQGSALIKKVFKVTFGLVPFVACCKTQLMCITFAILAIKHLIFQR